MKNKYYASKLYKPKHTNKLLLLEHAMETLGLGHCWENLPEGYQFKTVSRTITEIELINFINTAGMVEVLFTDQLYAAKHAPQGKRLLPGALVYSIAEGLVLQSTLQGTGLAFLKMEMDIKGPSFVGDTVHAEVKVLQSRPTSKDPNRGIVETENKIINQHGEVVIVYKPLRLMAGKKMLAEHWSKD